MTRDEFRNHVAIVTGASSGIGRALALALAERGSRVVLAARDATRLESLAGECRQRGGEALSQPTDVSDEQQCRTLVQAAIEQYQRLDLLVNNAGIGMGCLFPDLPNLELFRSVVATNFWGAVHCCIYAMPHLLTSQGRVVNVSSLGGMLAIPGNSSYVASKAALNGFSDALRLDLAKSGVSVTLVCPYWVVTEFHERFMDRHGAPSGPGARALYTPRMMTAAQAAAIILRAAWRRQREVVMWPGAPARWLKLLAPAALDHLIVRQFFKPAVERMKKGMGG